MRLKNNQWLLHWYPKKSKGYGFYCLDYSTRIVKAENVMFIENGDNNESMEPHKVEIEEVRVQVSLLLTSSQVVVPTIVEQFDNLQEQQMNDQIPYNEIVAYEPIVDEPYEVTLRRSQKQKRSVISNVIWFIYKSKNLN